MKQIGGGGGDFDMESPLSAKNTHNVGITMRCRLKQRRMTVLAAGEQRQAYAEANRVTCHMSLSLLP